MADKPLVQVRAEELRPHVQRVLSTTLNEELSPPRELRDAEFPYGDMEVLVFCDGALSSWRIKSITLNTDEGLGGVEIILQGQAAHIRVDYNVKTNTVWSAGVMDD